MATVRPHRVRVRMYQVGFGDCFLLSFEYKKKLGDGRKERHVLVDFGSTSGPKQAKLNMVGVAEAVGEHTGGKLDVLVVTHRHKDHLSGFENNDAADVIESLKPTLVVRPWTENPKAAAKARVPLTRADFDFAKGLDEGQAFARALADALGVADKESHRGRLGLMALEEVKNLEAIKRIDKMAKAGSAKYVFAGEDSGIEDVCPGVKVDVLGPPTVDQWAEVAQQREADKEYWMLYRRMLSGRLGADVARAVVEPGEGLDGVVKAEALCAPGPVRWLVEHMQSQTVHSLKRLVRSFDRVLNNTSIVLLFEVGDRRLLFPGDAQIENWNYTLNNWTDSLRERLATVDLYKVGHHGSRNATPISLYKLWTAPGVIDRPMTTLMSTRADVHGKKEATMVPRATLVNALRERSAMFSTEDLAPGALFVEVAADTKGPAPFTEL